MTLIADSGSTKTNWCLLKDNGERFFFDTEGYNPYFVDTAYVQRSLAVMIPADVHRQPIRHIHFYGAGCFEDKAGIILTALQSLFSYARINVQLDLLASAQAVLGDEPGFVAILGTGTNSCLYDGRKIVSNIDSLGYILGDEGSGFSIGRKLLGDFIRGYMPEAVERAFIDSYRLTREDIMERIYTGPLPNRFCASFTEFIQTCPVDREYTHGIVRSAFNEFFTNLVTHYPGYRQYTFNCVGSVGFVYKNLLQELATAYGMTTGIILKEPISGLADYYARRR